MPDVDGKLSDDERDTLLSGLVEAGVKKCPACGDAEGYWTVGSHAIVLQAGQTHGVYPVVAVICSRCSITQFVFFKPGSKE